MAEFPIMPVGTSDFLADTTHLSHEEMGLYWRMCLHLWRMPDRRFPNDDEWLSKRLGAAAAAVRALVHEFFQCDGNWITHKRINREYERAKKSSAKQSARAKSRYKKNNTSSRGSAEKTSCGTASTSTSTSTSTEKKDSVPIGTGAVAPADPWAAIIAEGKQVLTAVSGCSKNDAWHALKAVKVASGDSMDEVRRFIQHVRDKHITDPYPVAQQWAERLKANGKRKFVDPHQAQLDAAAAAIADVQAEERRMAEGRPGDARADQPALGRHGGMEEACGEGRNYWPDSSPDAALLRAGDVPVGRA